jgi:RND family efflux transporter MFP subunit
MLLVGSSVMRVRSASFVVLIASALVLAGCTSGHASDRAEEGPLVRTVVAGGPDQAALRVFTGSVRARHESDLGFRVGGQITARLVNDGEHVRRGQPLFRLDATDYQLGARAAAAEVAAAEARHRFAAAERDRLLALAEGGAVSRSDAERVSAEAAAAGEALRAARAASQTASNQNRYTTLVADADGVVTFLRADVGQVVAPGQPIVRLARDGAREIEVALPESLGGLDVGLVAQVRFLAGAETAPARLRELSGAADSVTRTFAARFALEEGAAPPLGSTASVSIPAANEGGTSGIAIPLSALHDAGQGPGVWVVNPETQLVAWRAVRVASFGDDIVRIAEGLATGEIVVALGAHLLTEGQTVRLEERANADSAGPDLRARTP